MQYGAASIDVASHFVQTPLNVQLKHRGGHVVMMMASDLHPAAPVSRSKGCNAIEYCV
jgi:hypothetical protein